MNRIAWLVGFTLICGAPLFAQPVSVQFVDGVLEVQQGSVWTAVDTGEEVPPDAVLRLGRGGSAELAQGERVIALSRAGTYRLADLLQAAGAASTWNMGTVVGSKLAALGSGQRTAESQAAQMGVRGRAQGDTGITWVEDDSSEAVKRGLAALAEGRPRDALPLFREAAAAAPDRATEQAALFYEAYTHDRLGERAQAMRLLARVNAGPADDYFRDYVMLKGRLLIEGADAPGALSLIDSYLASSPAGDGAQSAEILASFACRALGDRVQAVARLEKARDMAPDTEAGKQAAGLIDQIR